MRISMLSVAIGLILSTGPVVAMQSADTPDVVGHKPTIGSVTLDKTAAALGDVLNVIHSGYSDTDGDAEANPSIRWLRDGVPIAGQTASSHTVSPSPTCSDFNLSAEVTPTSQTGDPLTGDALRSASLPITYPQIPGFSKPDNVVRTWPVADSFCTAKGMRLPTVAELQYVFANYASGFGSQDMAYKYGWPLTNICGGANGYWTGDQSGNNRMMVYMNAGNSTSFAQNISGGVACTTGIPSGTPPVASNVSFNAPVANSNVTATWTYTDAEGDAESGTTVEWLVNGNVVGTGNPWRVVGTHAANNLTVRVTPKAATGIPSSTQTGAPVTSTGQQIKAAAIGRFIAPDSQATGWQQANAKCLGAGARLPTLNEMRSLYLSATSAMTLSDYNNELCDIYGWPLVNRQCGGIESAYWTSEQGANHFNIPMDGPDWEDDGYSDTANLQSVCIR
ncbi:hypothetical protein AjGTCBM29_04404 [Aeromonas jandaei]|nr:hypothetical protein AjGTCBM29_04404 [Aeromonas jandaei]